MGRPRKKIEPEIAEEETQSPSKTPTRMVDAEHTIKYREPLPVPIVEESEEEASFVWDEEDEKKPRKHHKSVREKIQERLAKAKVSVGAEQIYLRIDRLPNYESGSIDGMGGDKEFCWRGQCTVEYVTNDDYLVDTLKRHGAGVYWFTLRQGTRIIASWSHRIGGAPQAATPITTETGQQQIIYQPVPASANGQAPIPVTKSLKELADVIEIVDRIRGKEQPNPQPQAPPQPVLPPDVQLASLLMADGELKKKAITNLLGTKDKQTDYVAMAIEHGPSLIEALGRAIENVVKEIKSPNGTKENQPQQPIRQVWNGNKQTMDSSPEGTEPAEFSNLPETTTIQAGQNEARTITDPKDELIRIAMEGCAQNLPPRVTAGQLLAWADYVQEQFPTHSVYGWVDLFAEKRPEEIIAALQSGLLGESGIEVAKLPHAQQWIGELGLLLKSEEGEVSE